MSLSVNYLYKFGEFLLDVNEKTLARKEEQIELTPKGFDLLSVFVENHGRLLHKDELMDKIWADSFVEESNLTFNIRQLRKALGDDAQNPRYIKTVRGHGYRFIADVNQIPCGEKKRTINLSIPDVSELSAGSTEQDSSAPKNVKNSSLPLFAGLFILLLAVFFGGRWVFNNFFTKTEPSVLSAKFFSEKLSTNGKVNFAALSPDGKKAAYTNLAADNRQSIWLRQIETGENVEIVPPAEASIYDMEFSPDGSMIYFSRVSWTPDEAISLYRVSIFGGVVQKIINEMDGRVGISPDGKSISFNRCNHNDDQSCELWMADADGSNEKKLVSRPAPIRISDSDFSPDGKSIAFNAGPGRNKSNDFGIWLYDIETGKERELTSEKFYVITSVAWLPDGSGLLISAFKFPDKNFRIWKVSAQDEEITPLTKVSEHYEFLSIDKEASQVLAIQVKEDYRQRLINLDNPSETRPLPDAGSAAFASDGKIYFSSTRSGNHEIWSVNADGSNERQLTNNSDEDYYPIVSHDNKWIYFTSTRTGAAQIWRMNPDGVSLTQVTNQNGGFPLSITNDGEWLYYLHGADRTLWRVSPTTGEEQLVLNKYNWQGFAISPDGSMAAYPEKQSGENFISVVEIPGGKTVKTIRLTEKNYSVQQLGWMPDGQDILYVTSDAKFERLVLWKQSFNETEPRQIIGLGDEMISGFTLPVTPDGKFLDVVQQNSQYDAVLLKGLQ